MSHPDQANSEETDILTPNPSPETKIQAEPKTRRPPPSPPSPKYSFRDNRRFENPPPFREASTYRPPYDGPLIEYGSYFHDNRYESWRPSHHIPPGFAWKTEIWPEEKPMQSITTATGRVIQVRLTKAEIEAAKEKQKLLDAQAVQAGTDVQDGPIEEEDEDQEGEIAEPREGPTGVATRMQKPAHRRPDHEIPAVNLPDRPVGRLAPHPRSLDRHDDRIGSMRRYDDVRFTDRYRPGDEWEFFRRNQDRYPERNDWERYRDNDDRYRARPRDDYYERDYHRDPRRERDVRERYDRRQGADTGIEDLWRDYYDRRDRRLVPAEPGPARSMGDNNDANSDRTPVPSPHIAETDPSSRLLEQSDHYSPASQSTEPHHLEAGPSASRLEENDHYSPRYDDLELGTSEGVPKNKKGKKARGPKICLGGWYRQPSSDPESSDSDNGPRYPDEPNDEYTWINNVHVQGNLEYVMPLIKHETPLVAPGTIDIGRIEGVPGEYYYVRPSKTARDVGQPVDPDAPVKTHIDEQVLVPIGVDIPSSMRDMKSMAQNSGRHGPIEYGPHIPSLLEVRPIIQKTRVNQSGFERHERGWVPEAGELGSRPSNTDLQTPPAARLTEAIVQNIIAFYAHDHFEEVLPELPIVPRDIRQGPMHNGRLTSNELRAYKTATLRRKLFDIGRICRAWWNGCSMNCEDVVIVGASDAEVCGIARSPSCKSICKAKADKKRASRNIRAWIPCAEQPAYLHLTLQMPLLSAYKIIQALIAQRPDDKLSQKKPVKINGLTILHSYGPETFPAASGLDLTGFVTQMESIQCRELCFEAYAGDQVLDVNCLDVIAKCLRRPWPRQQKTVYRIDIKPDLEMAVTNAHTDVNKQFFYSQFLQPRWTRQLEEEEARLAEEENPVKRGREQTLAGMKEAALLGVEYKDWTDITVPTKYRNEVGSRILQQKILPTQLFSHRECARLYRAPPPPDDMRSYGTIDSWDRDNVARKEKWAEMRPDEKVRVWQKYYMTILVKALDLDDGYVVTSVKRPAKSPAVDQVNSQSRSKSTQQGQLSNGPIGGALKAPKLYAANVAAIGETAGSSTRLIPNGTRHDPPRGPKNWSRPTSLPPRPGSLQSRSVKPAPSQPAFRFPVSFEHVKPVESEDEKNEAEDGKDMIISGKAFVDKDKRPNVPDQAPAVSSNQIIRAVDVPAADPVNASHKRTRTRKRKQDDRDDDINDEEGRRQRPRSTANEELEVVYVGKSKPSCEEEAPVVDRTADAPAIVKRKREETLPSDTSKAPAPTVAPHGKAVEPVASVQHDKASTRKRQRPPSPDVPISAEEAILNGTSVQTPASIDKRDAKKVRVNTSDGANAARSAEPREESEKEAQRSEAFACFFWETLRKDIRGYDLGEIILAARKTHALWPNKAKNSGGLTIMDLARILTRGWFNGQRYFKLSSMTNTSPDVMVEIDEQQIGVAQPSTAKEIVNFPEIGQEVLGHIYAIQLRQPTLPWEFLDALDPRERRHREMWSDMFGMLNEGYEKWTSSEYVFASRNLASHHPQGGMMPMGWIPQNPLGNQVLCKILKAWYVDLEKLDIRCAWSDLYRDIRRCSKNGRLKSFDYRFVPVNRKAAKKTLPKNQRRKKHMAPHPPVGSLKSLDNILMWDFKFRPEKWFRQFIRYQLRKKYPSEMDYRRIWQEPPPRRSLFWTVHVPYDQWLQQKGRPHFKGYARREKWFGDRLEMNKALSDFLLLEAWSKYDPGEKADLEEWTDREYFNDTWEFLTDHHHVKTKVGQKVVKRATDDPESILALVNRTDGKPLHRITGGRFLDTKWVAKHVMKHQRLMANHKEVALRREERLINDPLYAQKRDKVMEEMMRIKVAELTDEEMEDLFKRLKRKYGAQKLFQSMHWPLRLQGYPGVTLQVEKREP